MDGRHDPVESNHVLCVAGSTNIMVNNWYSVLYSPANGLKPKTIGHEDPTKRALF